MTNEEKEELEFLREYHRKNQEKAEYMREYYRKNREKCQETRRKSWHKNKEEVNRRRREKQKTTEGKIAKSKSDKTYYEKNKEKIIERLSVRQKEWTKYLSELKSSVGCKCGEKDPSKLDFHHRDPSTKLKKVAVMHCYSKEKQQAEIDKCDILCKTCHIEHHRMN